MRNSSVMHRWRTAFLSLLLIWSVGPQIACADSRLVELLFVGDVSFAGRPLPPKNAVLGKRNPLRDVASLFKQAALVVANGEGLLTETPPAAYGAKRLNIGASPLWAGVYHAAGVDLVGLANNHTWDDGAAGVLENRQHLLATGVAVYGAGPTEATALAPYTLVSEGRCQVAIVPATLKSNRPARRGAKAAYYRGTKGLHRLEARIRNLKAQQCVVIVSVHWGKEGVHYPPQSVVRAAHRIVDAGADVVIGHHPHVLQGVEYYRGVPIAYSLGNFVFTNRTPDKRETGIFSVKLSSSVPSRVVQVGLIPATIAIRGGFVPRLSTESESQRTERRLREWSRPWGTRVGIEHGVVIFKPPMSTDTQ